MTGLLICAAVVAFVGGGLCYASGATGEALDARVNAIAGLALIAVALWLAYAAGTLTNRNHDMTNPNDTPVRSYDR